MDLPISLKYTTDEASCEVQAAIASGDLEANLQEIVDSIEVCEQRCEVHNLTASCTRDQQIGEIILKVRDRKL